MKMKWTFGLVVKLVGTALVLASAFGWDPFLAVAETWLGLGLWMVAPWLDQLSAPPKS